MGKIGSADNVTVGLRILPSHFVNLGQVEERVQDPGVKTPALHQSVHRIASIVAKFQISIVSDGDVTARGHLEIAARENRRQPMLLER